MLSTDAAAIETGFKMFIYLVMIPFSKSETGTLTGLVEDES